MAIKVEQKAADGRPSAVRVTVNATVEEGQWPLDVPGLFEVAAGGTVIWEFVAGLSGTDRPAVRVVAAESLSAGDGQPVFFDPFETLDLARNERGHIEIVGATFPEAKGRYTYVLEVDRGQAGRKGLRCAPARMGGINVSGPPKP